MSFEREQGLIGIGKGERRFKILASFGIEHRQLVTYFHQFVEFFIRFVTEDVHRELAFFQHSWLRMRIVSCSVSEKSSILEGESKGPHNPILLCHKF